MLNTQCRGALPPFWFQTHGQRCKQKSFTPPSSTARRSQQARGLQQGRPSETNERRIDAREIAIQQLLKIEEGGFVGRIGSRNMLNTRHYPTPYQQNISAADQRKVTILVAETTRMKRLLDFRIEKLSSKNIKNFDLIILLILRLGIYQLIEEKLPAHVVSAYVNLTKSLAGPAAAPLVNAVLRNTVRALEAGSTVLPEAPPSSAPKRRKIEFLGVLHSHPNWMIERWLNEYGESQIEEVLRANNRTPAYAIRVNTLKVNSAEAFLAALESDRISASTSKFLPGEFICVEAGLQSLLQEASAANGHCMVQDEAAGLVVALLDPKPGERIWDACAAPGGKTLFAAARMKNQGLLLATDANAKRLGALRRAAAKCGVGEMLTLDAVSVQNLADEAATCLCMTDEAPQTLKLPNRPAESAGGETWNGLDTYHGELDEFYGSESSIASLFESWGVSSSAGQLRRSSSETLGDSDVMSFAFAAPPEHEDPDTETDSDEDEYDGKGWQLESADAVVPTPARASLQHAMHATKQQLPHAMYLLTNPFKRYTHEQRFDIAIQAFVGLNAGFDKILLDVPCSGHGVLAKRADLRWKRLPENLEQLVNLQAEMLKAASRLVRPGGLLLYSTCSIERCENEDQVFQFLSCSPSFALESAPISLLPTEVVSQQGFLKTLPHLHGIDGAFAARLRKKS